jgi:uncharacterized membrane-anchored protein
MKKLRLIVFLLVALAQVSVPASMIWKRQRTLREGHLWKFRTAPVDPVDALRGRYLSLRFAAEEFPSKDSPLSRNGNVYVAFKEDADGFASVDRVSENRIPGDAVIRTDRYGFYDGKAHVIFPFDKFWVSESDASAAEQAYAAHSRRGEVDAYVTVRIRNGDAGIEELYLGGQPLREYLRARTAP